MNLKGCSHDDQATVDGFGSKFLIVLIVFVWEKLMWTIDMV